jgi:hypothetical protein
MANRCAMLATIAVVVLSLSVAAQSATDEVVKMASGWLTAISVGDRATLSNIMDPNFLATTPGGDVVTKERLVPNDANKPVQKLPQMELDAPMVRIYGTTAVLMSRLKSAGGPAMNATFVFSKDRTWKLVAIQLSPQK